MNKLTAIFGLLFISSSVFAGESIMYCPVQYGSGQSLVEFQMSVYSENGKVVGIRIRDEANRELGFDGSEIKESDQKDLKKDTYFPEPALYSVAGNNGQDSVSLVIPAQNPLSEKVTAYVVAYSKTLNARIPIADPAKTICTKQ